MAIRYSKISFSARWLLVSALLSLVGCSEPYSWAPSESLLEGRAGHTATLLDDGSVLFAGGQGKTILSSAELRDTTTGRWSPAANLNTPRAEHTATRIDGGRVMLVGGKDQNDEILDSAEMYENGKFRLLPLNQQRIGHTATWIDVGKSVERRLVVAGGEQSTGSSKSIEFYDAANDKWTAMSGLMQQARSAHTATPLDDGMIVIVGGKNGEATLNGVEQCKVEVPCADGENTCIKCDIVKCGDEPSEPSKCKNEARSMHTATRLDSNLILVVGGLGIDDTILKSAELYNPSTGQLLSVGDLHEARYGHTATRLHDGSVLVTGGTGAGGALDSVERLIVERAEVGGVEKVQMTSEVITPMSTPRVGHSATWLTDGSVVFAGGEGDAALGSVDRFVLEDLRLLCERSEDCPKEMACNEEKRCEIPPKPLEANNACAMSTNSLPGKTGVGFVGIALAAAALRRRARRNKNVAIVLGFGALFFVPNVAQAQAPTFYLDRLQIAGGPNDGTAVWRPVFGPTRLFGQFAGGYALNPLRVETVGRDAVRAQGIAESAVRLQLTGYLTAGVEMAKRGAIQVSVPYIVEQRVYGGEIGLFGVAQRALGDARVDGRMLLAWSESRAFQVAVRGAFFLPIGDETSFAGERGAWGNAGLSAEYDAGAFFLTGNAGMSIRPRSRLNDLTVGTEFVYAVGVYAPLMRDRLRLGAEIFGSVGLVSNGAVGEEPLEGALTTRVGLGAMQKVFLGVSAGGRLGFGYAPDMRFVARLGGVLSFDRAPVAPRLPVLPTIEWREPEEGDADHDGFVDSTDACPDKAEDHKGAKDGCPEVVVDSDGDGIVDAVDKCPAEAELKNGIADEDGCPEQDTDGDGIVDDVDDCPNEVGVAATPPRNGCALKEFIEIAKEIRFQSEKDTIDPSSEKVLDKLAQILEEHPEVKLRIEGHTDDRVGKIPNEKLSTDRAKAIYDELIKRGVSAARLSFKGYGSSKPIVSNDTPAGRAKNRRVELHLEK